ncbi:MAG: hypothetical protein M3R45_00525 [Pseudomonadota bacterium]|nr:hypothetical protein [Pseudomonadota bacterium]
MAAFLMGNAHAKSPSSGAGDAAGTSKARKKTTSQAGHVSRVTFLRDSAETPKERSSRLKRECKGRVNAGACAGYTY